MNTRSARNRAVRRCCTGKSPGTTGNRTKCNIIHCQSREIGCIRHVNMAMNARNSPGAGRPGRVSSVETKTARERPSDEDFLAALGRKVRDRREQRRFARKMLAEAADVSERYLAQLES